MFFKNFALELAQDMEDSSSDLMSLNPEMIRPKVDSPDPEPASE